MIWDTSKVDLEKKAQLGVNKFDQGVNVTLAFRKLASYPFPQNLSIVGKPLSMTVYYEKDGKVISNVENMHYNKRILLLDPKIELNNLTAIVIA